jgi:hypothetical protein
MLKSKSGCGTVSYRTREFLARDQGRSFNVVSILVINRDCYPDFHQNPIKHEKIYHFKSPFEF